MKKKRIMFVDDEPNILKSFQRMLHDMRGEWEMTFVSSAREALEKLAEEDFDVLVSDVLMPEMNGLELLNRVMMEFPRVVRIIVSGHFDQEMTLGSVRLAHQSMHKPCKHEEVKATIQRAFLLQEELAGDELKELVSSMDRLPSLPTLYDKIIDVLNSPDASMRKVGEIISQDIGMTAKVLQLVNSAYFGLRRQINTPTEAVVYLGMEQIKALVLSVHIFTHAETGGRCQEYLKLLWEHSFVTGLFSKAITEYEGQDKAIVDLSFTAGVLHDVGKLIFIANFPDKYDELIRRAREEHKFFHELEKEMFNATHSEIGAYLLSIWGLPDKLVESVMFHHSPSLCIGETFDILTAVHVANHLSARKVYSGRSIKSQIDQRYLERVHVSSHMPDYELAILRATEQSG